MLPFADNARTLARTQRLSSSDLAALTRLHPVRVAQLLGGQHHPCPKEAQLIARALNTTPDALYHDNLDTA